MRLIRKTYRILGDNSGKTMVEVIVAFALLSIMLLAFSEGIAWATRTEINASKSRSSADIAMRVFQEYIATGSVDSSNYDCVVELDDDDVTVTEVDGGWLKKKYTVKVDGKPYVYYGYGLPG